MSKKEQPKEAQMSRNELKKMLIQQILRAQKANIMDEGRANSSGSAMNIIKSLIPKR